MAARQPKFLATAYSFIDYSLIIEHPPFGVGSYGDLMTQVIVHPEIKDSCMERSALSIQPNSLLF